MEKLVEEGLVRNIGLSNFNSEQIIEILREGKVCLCYSVSPYTSITTRLLFYIVNNVFISIYVSILLYPFDVGKIRPVVNQVECHAYLNQEKLLKFCNTHQIQLIAYSPLGSPGRLWAQPNEVQLLKDNTLINVSAKYNKTPAQILLKWQVGI